MCDRYCTEVSLECKKPHVITLFWSLDRFLGPKMGRKRVAKDGGRGQTCVYGIKERFIWHFLYYKTTSRHPGEIASERIILIDQHLAENKVILYEFLIKNAFRECQHKSEKWYLWINLDLNDQFDCGFLLYSTCPTWSYRKNM
jgi:hypothetical protein